MFCLLNNDYAKNQFIACTTKILKIAKDAIKKIPGAVRLKRKLGYNFMKTIGNNKRLVVLVLSYQYKRATGKQLNLNPPRTFNEKMQWTKLHDANPLRSTFTDKFAVREYVAEKIGGEHLIPLLGVWTDAKDIDFDTLPQQFVLKCTHDLE